jgi:hypothetical protein
VVPFGIGQGALVWWGLADQRPLPPAPLSVLAFPSAWAAGYLLGGVAAELTRQRPHPRQVRAAILAPRRLADYLPAWMLRSERAVALAVLGLRAMVRRPQPVASTGELAVDDALRSTSLHRAAGAGLAALLFLLGNQLGALDRHWWALTGFLALVCYGLAIGCWKDLTSPLWWPIRRDTGPRPPHPGPTTPTAGAPAGVGMILQLDPDSPIPPYEQLRGQITTMVVTGVLPQGARLPPIRQLARDLGLAAAAHRFAVQTRQLGVDPEQALRQARQALDALAPRPSQA